MRLAGDLIGDVDERGEPIVDDTALILLNAHHEPIPFTLPQTLRRAGLGACPGHLDGRRRSRVPSAAGDVFDLRDRSLAILFTRDESEAAAPVSTAEIERLRREARRPEPPVPRHKAAPRREV